MNGVVETTNLPTSLSYNERDYSSLIKWIESIPSSQQPQNYLAIAFVIQHEIEPIIRKEEPQIVMQGNVLSPGITQSKSFISQRKEVLSYTLDPIFHSLINSDEIPLTESIVMTQTEEKVNKLSKVILLACRIDKDKSSLEYFCQGAIQEINRIKDTIKGSFNVSAQALMSESPCLFTDSAELPLLASSQNTITQSEKESKQLIFRLEPKEVLILEKHFDHGESEKIHAKLSIALQGDKIATTQKKKISKSEFVDLRYESEESFSL